MFIKLLIKRLKTILYLIYNYGVFIVYKSFINLYLIFTTLIKAL
jgi:hypothetical protein